MHFSLLQKGIIETDDGMYVMEPADGKNKDHSHVAYKMKRKSMKFEDSNGINVLCCLPLLNYLLCYHYIQLFLALPIRLRMDGQSFSVILYTTNANLAINYLDLLSENVCSLESGVATHQFVLVKVCKGL